MSHKRTSSILRRVGLLVGTGAVAVLVSGVAGAGVAAADTPVDSTTTWTGTFPLSGDQPVDIQVVTSLPSPVAVDTESGPYDVTLTTIAGEGLRGSLNLLGATTIEGTASASTTITDAAGQTYQQFIEFVIPQQPVPTSGNLIITGTGTTAVPAIANAGAAGFAIDPEASAHLHPKTSSGGNTFLGEFDVPLTLNQGEDPSLGAIDVQ